MARKQKTVEDTDMPVEDTDEVITPLVEEVETPSINDTPVEEVETPSIDNTPVEEVEHLPLPDIPQFVQKRKGRVAGAKNKAKAVEVKSIPELDLKLFADMLDSIAISMIGDEAAMSVIEKTLLYTGIEHYAKTVGVETVQRISASATPFFLIAGLGVWGLRIWTLYTAKKRKAKVIEFTAVPNTLAERGMNMGVPADYLFNNTNKNGV